MPPESAIQWETIQFKHLHVSGTSEGLHLEIEVNWVILLMFAANCTYPKTQPKVKEIDIWAKELFGYNIWNMSCIKLNFSTHKYAYTYHIFTYKVKGLYALNSNLFL